MRDPDLPQATTSGIHRRGRCGGVTSLLNGRRCWSRLGPTITRSTNAPTQATLEIASQRALVGADVPACIRTAEASDFYAAALHCPTLRFKVFQRSTAIAFNLRQSSDGRELEMARTTDTPVKRTIRKHQLREMVPLADSTIYEMEQRGEFPRRFALSPRCVVWDLAEVEAWLAARRASSVRRAQHPDVRQRRARPVKERDQAQ